MRNLIIGALALIASTVAANATAVTGTYSIASSASPTITDDLASPFSLNLTLNVPQTFDFATIVENAIGNSTLAATFNFTAPVMAGPTVINGTDSAGAFLAFGSDDLEWNGPGTATVNFSDGAILDITLHDADFSGLLFLYQGVTPQVTFDLVHAPSVSAVPEPMTLSLFGAGLAGIAVAARRRKQRKA